MNVAQPLTQQWIESNTTTPVWLVWYIFECCNIHWVHWALDSRVTYNNEPRAFAVVLRSKGSIYKPPMQGSVAFRAPPFFDMLIMVDAKFTTASPRLRRTQHLITICRLLNERKKITPSSHPGLVTLRPKKRFCTGVSAKHVGRRPQVGVATNYGGAHPDWRTRDWRETRQSTLTGEPTTGESRPA